MTDTTKTLIEMADCPEIQEGHGSLNKGDWFATPETFWDTVDNNTRIRREGYVVDVKGVDSDPFYIQMDIQRYIWLPTFTQSMAMVPQYWVLELRNLWAFFTGTDGGDVIHNAKYARSFKSWEQLGIAFVMFELHKKVWCGEKWV